MSGRSRTAAVRPVLQSTEAQLYVADVPASCEFYTKKLGFAVVFVYGDPPFYAQVQRDHAQLNVRLVHEPVFNGDIREREQLLCASVTVATPRDIKKLFLEFQASDVGFSQALREEDWGASTFVIRDPDGNLVMFAAPAR